ncbi:MAG TPA: HEPN domain-containing protein [Deltaproteobacteria bacterium]|nr:HEPN domain-containing protein [Deltaproteobacteria bacterium]
MDKEEHITYWINSADHDLDVAETLFQSGKYDWCLFLGHLVLEKMLKALFVKVHGNKLPPRTHNLVRLAELCNISLSEEQELFLDKVSDFNLEIRYPDYRQKLYEKCTYDLTLKYFTRIKEFYRWFHSLLESEEQ